MPTTGTEFMQLTARVVELEAQVQFLYKHLGVTYMPAAGDDSDIEAWLKKGDMIQAIQAYRNKYNVGLREAKAGVEDLKARRGY